MEVGGIPQRQHMHPPTVAAANRNESRCLIFGCLLRQPPDKGIVGDFCQESLVEGTIPELISDVLFVVAAVAVQSSASRRSASPSGMLLTSAIKASHHQAPKTASLRMPLGRAGASVR